MSVLESYSQLNFSCFPSELGEVQDVARRQFKRSSTPSIEREGPVDLSQIYVDEPHPGWEWRNAMFFTPRAASSSTVMFAKGGDGWSTLARSVVKSLKQPVVYLFRIGSDQCEWPAYSFNLEVGGQRVRHISVLKDVDRWVFWQEGDPLPEEDPSMYTKRRVRDRLPREYMVALAERMGFPIADDAF